MHIFLFISDSIQTIQETKIETRIHVALKLVIQFAQDTEMIKYYSSFNSIGEAQAIDTKDRIVTLPKRIHIQFKRLISNLEKIKKIHYQSLRQKNNKENHHGNNTQNKKQRSEKGTKDDKRMIAMIRVMRKIETRMKMIILMTVTTTMMEIQHHKENKSQKCRNIIKN